MQELEYSDRPNVLAAAEFSAWLIPFLHPTSSPPPRSFRLIPPLAAVICYSYFLHSGKWSFRLFLELNWNRSYNVGIFKLLFSCLLLPTGKEIESNRVKWNNEQDWWHSSFFCMVSNPFLQHLVLILKFDWLSLQPEYVSGAKWKRIRVVWFCCFGLFWSYFNWWKKIHKLTRQIMSAWYKLSVYRFIV